MCDVEECDISDAVEDLHDDEEPDICDALEDFHDVEESHTMLRNLMYVILWSPCMMLRNLACVMLWKMLRNLTSEMLWNSHMMSMKNWLHVIHSFFYDVLHTWLL